MNGLALIAVCVLLPGETFHFQAVLATTTEYCRPWRMSLLCWLSVIVSLIQVESLTIRPERPLVVMSMTRPRRSFGLPCKLVDRDAYDWLTDDYMAKVEMAEGYIGL